MTDRKIDILCEVKTEPNPRKSGALSNFIFGGLMFNPLFIENKNDFEKISDLLYKSLTFYLYF